MNLSFVLLGKGVIFKVKCINLYNIYEVCKEFKDSGRTSVLTFSDVINKFGADVKQEQLEFANKRAGNAFKDQMAQNFVVLNETRVTRARAGGSGVAGRAGGDIHIVIN